jgi:1,2-dihydroxy-3-keto-5-methylthiopentene dioxygenase
MDILHIPGENLSLQQYDEIREFLAVIGIDYERWEPVAGVTSEASSEQILDVYSKQINVLKRRVGYVTADVIDVNKDTPVLDA